MIHPNDGLSADYSREELSNLWAHFGFSIGEHACVGKRPAQRAFLAQPADLLPTITELADARIDLPEPLHGHSFVKALKGQTKSHRALAVCGQWTNSPAKGVPLKWTVPFVTDGQWGYVPLGPTGDPEIFDLPEDPLGERNLFRRARPHARRLRNLLLDYMRDLQAPQAVTDFLAKL